MKNILIVFITLFASLFTILNTYASDTAKETRWADQVVDALLDGDAVWLNTSDTEQPAFLSILTEASEASHDAVIIMHGTGAHPDWQQVIQPLRVGLTEHGWHTLSIQMPILHNEASYDDYAPLFEEVTPRIQAAIKHLQAIGVSRIILIGHSLGSAMGAYHYQNPTQTYRVS